MGKLIEGKWHTDDEIIAYEKAQYKESNGRFQRGTAQFRNWITEDGTAGPTGDAGFAAEAGRYHLYAALNCPWAHRTMLYRNLKKLQEVIPMSLVTPLRTEQGWVFNSADPKFTDDLYGFSALHQLYSKASNDYTGRVTVPVLWDKKQQTVVSSESAEIIRMFNTAFNKITGDQQDFYPDHLATEIDALNEEIYNNLNNGVYKTGFARTQEAYDESVYKVFETLDKLEQRLESNRYLLGENPTEADWRLLPTLVRFDVGYYTAFKCNIKALRDYKNLSRYLAALYAIEGVAETVNFDVYRRGYNSKSPVRNPHGIMPIGLAPVL